MNGKSLKNWYNFIKFKPGLMRRPIIDRQDRFIHLNDKCYRS